MFAGINPAFPHSNIASFPRLPFDCLYHANNMAAQLAGRLPPTAWLQSRKPCRRSVIVNAKDDQGARSTASSNNRKRQGRPVYLKGPYDSPGRDGNRDRLFGLLTDRLVACNMHCEAEARLCVEQALISRAMALLRTQSCQDPPILHNGDQPSAGGVA
jgi:hypothetical protein